jgi:hypothetical protein
MNERIYDPATGWAAIPLCACSFVAPAGGPSSENHVKSDFTMMKKSLPKDIAAFAELVAIQPLTQRQYQCYRDFVQQLAISGRLGTPLPHSGAFELPILGAILLTYDVCIVETEDGTRLCFQQAYGPLQGAFFLPPDKADQVELQIRHARQWLRSTGIKAAMQAVGKLQAEFANQTQANPDQVLAHLAQLSAKLMTRIPNPE